MPTEMSCSLVRFCTWRRPFRQDVEKRWKRRVRRFGRGSYKRPVMTHPPNRDSRSGFLIGLLAEDTFELRCRLMKRRHQARVKLRAGGVAHDLQGGVVGKGGLVSSPG